MDFVLLTVGLLILGFQLAIYRQVKATERATRRLSDLNTKLLLSRQSRSRTVQRMTEQSPPIDARARTTRRDSNDLAPDVMVARVKSVRVGGEPNGSSPDDQLQ